MASSMQMKPQSLEATSSGVTAKSVGRAHMSYLPQRPPVTISFQDLTYSVPQGRKGNYNLLTRTLQHFILEKKF